MRQLLRTFGTDNAGAASHEKRLTDSTVSSGGSATIESRAAQRRYHLVDQEGGVGGGMSGPDVYFTAKRDVVSGGAEVDLRADFPNG